ncbi:MAG TPA: sugar transferase [Gaiellaceae bacterium]|jgi:exopolysaccharide biosynthesis polyprenyl glycosylphosphotransferase|nr:sugar transferase [Gaiellaceae bacterium]
MSLNMGEVQFELESPAVVATPKASVLPAAGRRALHDGRARTLGVVMAAVGVGLGFEGMHWSAVGVAALLAASWAIGIQTLEHSLRTVRVAAGHFGAAVLSTCAGLAMASAATLWIAPGLGHRIELFTMACLVLVLLYALESGKVRLVDLRANVLVVGGGKPAVDLLALLAADPEQPFRVTGIVDGTTAEAVAGVPVLGGVDALPTVLERAAPDLVVVAADRGRPEIFRGLAQSAERGFRVVGLPEFYEHAFGRVPVREMTDAWFMSILHLYQRPYSRFTKRAFDLIVAAAGLLLTAPLFPLIMLMIRASGGPVFYRQTRLGEHGRPFTILKFRSMRTDAESFGAVWAEESDVRITRIGRVLRRSRLDELPQLINVIRGEMSIVGPRPERPEFLEMLEASVPYWTRRHLLRPGITGWAQLRSGYAFDSNSTEEKLAHDLWYLRHQGLMIDLVICGRTIPALLLGTGR